MIGILTISIIIILFSGCATPYQRVGLTGGYSETQLDDNVFKVNFRGNGYTSSERSADLCLLRSAELCKLAGYNYFIIVEGREYTKQSQYTSPTRSTTTGRANVIGDSIYGSSTTTTTGGQTFIISKPRSTNIIVCFVNKPDGFSYNAEFIYDSLSKKYIMTH